jgi:hypothetical protein
MALADTEALEAGTAERCCRWRESHKMSQAKVIEKSAVIERLQLAIKAVEIDSDECMDFDECTAMLIPLDTYHQLIEAIPTDSKQILADWMREQLGSPVAWKVSNAVGIGYGDTFQALPEDTDLFKLPDILK